MEARGVDGHGSYDPAKLKMLGDAFDAAWNELAPTISDVGLTPEIARTDLASIILAIGNEPVLDVDTIKNAALKAMAERRPAASGAIKV